MSGGAISWNASEASGGGIYLIDSGSTVTSLDLDGVTVSGNAAGPTSGGLYLSSRTWRRRLRYVRL